MFTYVFDMFNNMFNNVFGDVFNKSESTLTRLLKDSFGGKTKTAVIATISP